MKPATLETLIWVLIYTGMIVGCTGIFLRRQSPVLGYAAVVVGGLLTVAGVVLVWQRSRTKA